jgi:hypothetical protein
MRKLKRNFNHTNKQIKTRAGRRLMISTFFIFSRLMLKPIRMIPPTTVISDMISPGISLPTMDTSSVIPPWNSRRRINEKSTPMPNPEASMMEEKKSITDLVSSKSDVLPKPSSIAPTIVIEPMLKSRKAVISPSVKRSFFDRVWALI